MSRLPGVYSTENDRSLGAIVSGGKLLAILGPAKDGPIGIPASYSNWRDAKDVYKGGPLLEAAAYYNERYKQPVLMCRCAAETAASVGTVGHAATGTSAVTIANGATPLDHYELALEFLNDGTIGTTGIQYRVSFDNGRTWSGTMSLGTATSIVLTEAGVTFSLAAGTVKKGDLHTARATPATPTEANITAALEGLRLTLAQWRFVLYTEVVDATKFDVLDAVGTYPNGPHEWLASPRAQNVGESNATWQGVMATLSAAKASSRAGLMAGACMLSSPLSGASYRRPTSWAASVMAAVSEEVNVAEPRRGALPGVAIRDANGNPVEHDEAAFPGLDAMRFGTLRTWPRRQGVYITLPRTFAATGSDFDIFPYRLVMDLMYELLDDYLTDRIHRPILVSRKTGLILPSEAKDIELGGDAVLRAGLLATPKASGAKFTVSRTDNLLSLPVLNCGGKLIPLGYPREINLGLSFENPAIRIEAV